MRLRSLLLALLVVGCGGPATNAPATYNPSNPIPNAVAPRTQEPAWYPAGFTTWPEDRSIAWRWLEEGEKSCTFDRCLGMYVIPKDGCESLYVEISLRDASENVIGYTNDAVGAVPAGEQAKVIFDVVEDAATGGIPAEFSCR